MGLRRRRVRAGGAGDGAAVILALMFCGWIALTLLIAVALTSRINDRLDD